MSPDVASSPNGLSASPDPAASSRYAFIGLGNPGEAYERTRHNIGFRIIDVWLHRLRLQMAPVCREFHSVIAGIGHHEVVLLKPMTYMNRSGRAVVEACRRYALDLANILVICDDVNLPFGTLRLRGRGSDGGHNGLASIIEALGSNEFARQRVGVSAPPDGVDRVEYVLDAFTTEEENTLQAVFDRAYEQLLTFVEEGWMMAASRHNG